MKSFGVKFDDGAVVYVYAMNDQNAATLARAQKIKENPNYCNKAIYVEEAQPGQKLSWGPASAKKGSGFVNLFVNANGDIQAGGVYPTREIADGIAQPTRYACVPISWPACHDPKAAYEEAQRRKNMPRGAEAAFEQAKSRHNRLRGDDVAFVVIGEMVHW